MAFYDQYGKLMLTNGKKSLFKCGYDSVKAGQMHENVTGINRFSRLNRRRGRVLDDTENTIDPGNRRELINLSRLLCAENSILDVCIETLADWTIGNEWRVFYVPTKNTPPDFEKYFEDFINYEFNLNCSVRGSSWTLKRLLHLWITESTRDGDFANIFFENENGFPQV